MVSMAGKTVGTAVFILFAPKTIGFTPKTIFFVSRAGGQEIVKASPIVISGS
jgi:hypothetical protein